MEKENMLISAQTYIKIIKLGILLVALAACSPNTKVLPKPSITQATLPTVPVDDSQIIVSATSTDINSKFFGVVEKNVIVVYEKAGNLWKMTDKGDRQLTNSGMDSQPILSARGEKVAFLRGSDLWAADLTDFTLQKLFSEDGVIPSNYEFSPDLKTLYFTTTTLNNQPRQDLFVVNIENGMAESLLSVGKGGNLFPSNDWKTLGVVQPEKIFTYNIQKRRLTLLYEYKLGSNEIANYYPPMAWLNGDHGFNTIIPSSDGKLARLMYIPAEGGKPAQLAMFDPTSFSESTPILAPDGTRVLYVKEHDTNFEIRVIDASTTDKLLISKPTKSINILGWLPSSLFFIFWMDDHGSVWVSNGAANSRIDKAYSEDKIIWVNDNNCIFLHGNELLSYSIGGSSTVIAENASGSFDARFSP